MNPYLRIIQPERASTYLYATNILESPWPEMEPVSSNQPSVRAEILKEWPLDMNGTTLAMMGVFFGDELVFELWAQKYLTIDDNKVFVWSERPPYSKIDKLGIPTTTYNRSGPQLINIRPAVTPGGAPGGGELITVGDPVAPYEEGWDKRFTTSIKGNSQLHDDIDEAIEIAYANWDPRAPFDLHNERLGFVNTLLPPRPPGGKLSRGYHWINACPRGHGDEKIVIAYAMWVWSKPMSGWEKATPIFTVLNLTRAGLDESTIIYTSASEAVKAAFSTCDFADNQKVEELTAEISAHVDKEMAKYREVE